MSGGKSYLLRWACVVYSIYLFGKYKIKNIPIGLFSEDYPTLKDRQISRIDKEFPRWLGVMKETKIEGLALHINEAYGGGRILLRNLDDPSKYMSSEFAGIFVEELTRNDEDTFRALRNRLRYPGIDEVKFMGATNPGGKGHAFVKKLFVDKNTDDPEQDRFFYVHANAYDNSYISPEYIKQLEALPEQLRKAYLDGSWDIFAGQFFSEWRHTHHVINPFIPDKKQYLFVAGTDWGYTAPFAMSLLAIEKVELPDGRTFNRTKMFAEVYGTEKTPKEWAYEIKKTLEYYNLRIDDLQWVRGDPKMWSKGDDGSESISDQFVNNGIRMRQANNDRVNGWVTVRKWLSLAPDGKPYLQVTSNCKNFIETFPSLVHDENKLEDIESIGTPDHLGDSIRYALVHMKWIDGRVGGVIHGETKKYPTSANMKDDGQLSVNLDRWQV